MSVFEHIKQAMESGGYEVLFYAWLITALIISWFFAIPLGIKETIKRIKERKQKND